MNTQNTNTTKKLEEDILSELIEDELEEEDFDDNIINIISSNTIHDRFQFESKFDFDLKHHENYPEKYYDIDVYFYIPKNIGINSNTYSNEQFYSDLTHYLRIRTPSIFNSSKENINDWKLPISEKYFEYNLIPHERQKLADAVVNEVKLFGCFINTKLKRLNSTYVRILIEKKDLIEKNPNILKAIKIRFESIETIITSFREKYLTKIRDKNVLIESEVKKAFLLVDEYISYRMEITLIRFMQILEKNKVPMSEVRILINKILEKESKYRTEVDIINLDGELNESIRETYYYRLGLLKKYVLEVLYLQSIVVKKEKIYRNVIAAFGAALAATFAALAEIQRMQLLRAGNNEVGARLTFLIFLGVIAYVFKDRIKDLSKEYFNQRLKKFLPDYDMKMFYTFFNQKGEKSSRELGKTREFVRYLSKDSTPQEINYIRNIGNRSELDPERNEVILHYSKKVAFELDSIDNGLSKIHYIRDISRFGISEFLEKLDDPQKTIRYFDSSNGIVSIETPKVYHINIVFRYALSYGDKKQKERKTYNVGFERIRVILNKKGIVRIEEVIPRGSINYSEN